MQTAEQQRTNSIYDKHHRISKTLTRLYNYFHYIRPNNFHDNDVKERQFYNFIIDR